MRRQFPSITSVIPALKNFAALTESCDLRSGTHSHSDLGALPRLAKDRHPKSWLAARNHYSRRLWHPAGGRDTAVGGYDLLSRLAGRKVWPSLASLRRRYRSFQTRLGSAQTV